MVLTRRHAVVFSVLLLGHLASLWVILDVLQTHLPSGIVGWLFLFGGAVGSVALSTHIIVKLVDSLVRGRSGSR
jgi:hypothetical protein